MPVYGDNHASVAIANVLDDFARDETREVVGQWIDEEVGVNADHRSLGRGIRALAAAVAVPGGMNTSPALSRRGVFCNGELGICENSVVSVNPRFRCGEARKCGRHRVTRSCAVGAALDAERARSKFTQLERTFPCCLLLPAGLRC